MGTYELVNTRYSLSTMYSCNRFWTSSLELIANTNKAITVDVYFAYVDDITYYGGFIFVTNEVFGINPTQM